MRARPQRIRDPKEFVHSHVDITPLVDAAISNDWDKVKELLDLGYSLLWYDDADNKNINPQLNASAMRRIAQRAPQAMIDKLTAYSLEANGPDSAAHRFILLEASKNPISKLAELYETINSQRHSNDPEDPTYPVCPESVYYLYLSGKHQLAFDAARNMRNSTKDDQDKDARIAALAQAACLYAGVTLGVKDYYLSESMAVIESSITGEIDKSIAPIFIAEAAACGYYDSFTKNNLTTLIRENAENIDVILGMAIISVARRGSSSLIFKLLELAKELKVNKNARFMKLLASASGAALVNEHFALAKVILLMVPNFEATPADIKELRLWPVNKINRMFRAINNYKIFTEIAMHACLTDKVIYPNWAQALKGEFGLDKMSDQGFNYIIHHPDAIALLFKYRPGLNHYNIDRGIISSIVNQLTQSLSPSDIGHFLEALSTSRAANQSVKNHFARVRYFTDEKVPHRISPDEERVCLKIKENLSRLLQDYKSPFEETRHTASRLHTALLDIMSLQMLKKLLDKELAAQKPKNILVAKSINHLLEKCVEILNKCQTEPKKSPTSGTLF